jgi:hypothetical protein
LLLYNFLNKIIGASVVAVGAGTLETARAFAEEYQFQGKHKRKRSLFFTSYLHSIITLQNPSSESHRK